MVKRIELSLNAGRDLLAGPVRAYLDTLPSWETESVRVIEIDPAHAAGPDFCRIYGVDPANGLNCVIVRGPGSDSATVAVCLAPVGSRLDLNGAVRRALGVKRVKMLERESATEATKMEEGAITPVGVPATWHVLLPPEVHTLDFVVVGGGKKNSKLKVPPRLLISLPNAMTVEGIAAPVQPH